MATVDDAAALQALLTELSELSISDVREVFRQYGDRSDFAEVLRAAFPELIEPYLQAAAFASARHYDELAPELGFKATPAPDLSADRVDGTIRWALFAPTGGMTPTSDEALARLVGSAQRMVFDASRQTVLTNLADEYDVPFNEVATPGTRWARHASANACGFCRMLATRAAVYRSEASASRVVGRSLELTTSDRRRLRQGRGNVPLSEVDPAAIDEALERRSRYSNARAARRAGKVVGDKKTGSLRGSRKYGDKFHDNCHCTAIAVRPGHSYEPPSYVEQWQQDYIAASRKSGDPKVISRLMESDDLHSN